jgi:hypothetical protein
LVFAIASCGSSGHTRATATSVPFSTTSTEATTTTSTGSQPDACSLLTGDDLKATIGAANGPGSPISNDFGKGCDFGTVSGDVQLTVFRPEVSDAVFNSGNSKTPVAAGAFYDSDWHRVRARKGAVRIQIQCTCTLSADKEPAKLAAAAAKALAHL